MDAYLCNLASNQSPFVGRVRASALTALAIIAGLSTIGI